MQVCKTGYKSLIKLSILLVRFTGGLWTAFEDELYYTRLQVLAFRMLHQSYGRYPAGKNEHAGPGMRKHWTG